MILSIKYNNQRVKVNSKGAELWSVQDKQGCEYLWQGDDTFWSDRAINIFPYVGHLTNGKYKIGENEYCMDIHGFVKDSEFEIETQEDLICLEADKIYSNSWTIEI